MKNFRIQKYDLGYVSEIRKPIWTLFGIKYKWAHFMSVSGIPEQPWYYSNKETAIRDTLMRIEEELL